jgi:hypothetical protein
VGVAECDCGCPCAVGGAFPFPDKKSSQCDPELPVCTELVLVVVDGLVPDVPLEDEGAGQSMPNALWLGPPGPAPLVPVDVLLELEAGSGSRYTVRISPALPPLPAAVEGRERD